MHISVMYLAFIQTGGPAAKTYKGDVMLNVAHSIECGTRLYRKIKQSTGKEIPMKIGTGYVESRLAPNANARNGVFVTLAFARKI